MLPVAEEEQPAVRAEPSPLERLAVAPAAFLLAACRSLRLLLLFCYTAAAGAGAEVAELEVLHGIAERGVL